MGGRFEIPPTLFCGASKGDDRRRIPNVRPLAIIARLRGLLSMMFRRMMVIAVFALPWARGALVWETEEIRLQAPSNAKEVFASYGFKNTGDTAVTIIEVLPSCACTTIETAKRSYAAGESGTLKVRLALESLSGSQEETIAVTTDDSPGEPVILRLYADIQPLIVLSPQVLSWSVGAEPEETSALAVASGPLRLASLTVTRTSPSGAAAVRVETVTEGSQYRIRVRPASTERTQNFTVSCTATFADGTTQDLVVFGMTRKRREGE